MRRGSTSPGGYRQPLPGHPQDRRRAGWGPSTPASTSRSARSVAIKILHPAYSTQQDLVERFRREARAASRIGHPHIIDVTDFGATEDGCAYFVMEHLDGIDLADVLSHERRLEPRRAPARSPSRSAARWRPRTPPASSTAISSRRTSSSSRATGRPTSSRCSTSASPAALGRARGASPTRAWPWGRPSTWRPSRREGGAVDQRSDIYSVGALIYEMVSGVRRRRCRATSELHPRRAGCKADVPEELDRIVVRALEPDPAPLPEHGAARIRPGEVAVRAPARRLRAAGPARSGARRRAGGLATRTRRQAATHPRADSPVGHAAPVRPRRCRRPPAAGHAATRERARGGHRRRRRSRARPAIRAAAGGTRGPFAALALVGVAAVTIYRRLPWNAHARQSPPRLRPRLRPRRPATPIAGPSACAPGWPRSNGCWPRGFGFAQLPALQAQLARLRADGGDRDRRHAGDARQGARW